MTKNTSKIRAVLLTALMVLSVFGGTVAFTGSASAATADGVTAGSSEDVQVESSSVNQTVSFDANPAGSGADSGLGNSSFTIDNSELDALGVVVNDVTLSVDTTNLTVNNTELLENGSFVLELNQSANDSAQVTAEFEFDTTGVDPTENVTQRIEAEGISPPAVQSFDLIDSDVDISLGASETFFQGQKLFFEADSESSQDYQIRFFDSDATSGQGGLVDEFTTSATGVHVIDTSGLVSDRYVLVDENGNTVETVSNGVEGGTNTTGNLDDTFEVVEQDLSTDFLDDDTVDNSADSTPELTINSVRGSSDLVVSSASFDYDDDELDEIFDESFTTVEDSDDEEFRLTGVGDGDFALNFSDIDAGDYEFEFEVLDSTASDSASITVQEADDIESSFTQSVYSNERGDVIEFTVELSNSDSAKVHIGTDAGQSDIGYGSNFTVVDSDDEGEDDDGQVTVQFNTRDPDTSPTAADDGDSIRNFGATKTTSAVLDVASYDINTSVGSGEDDVATLNLNALSVDSFTLYTAPDDSDIQDAEDISDIESLKQDGRFSAASALASGDYLYHELEVSGLSGMAASAEQGTDQGTVEEMLSNSTFALDLSIVETDESADANTDNKELLNTTSSGGNVVGDLLDGDGHVIVDGDNDTYYIGFPIEIGTVNNTSVADDDEFDVTVQLTENNQSLVDENVSVSQTFSVEERSVEFDTTLADDDSEIVEVEPGAGQAVTGTTNLAPGSEIDVRARATGDTPFLLSQTVETNGDRSFDAEFDFSDQPVGLEFEVTVDGPKSTGETVDAVIVDSAATETPEPTEEPEQTETPEETAEPTATATEEPTATETPGQPGFGVIVALLAFMAAALLAIRRD